MKYRMTYEVFVETIIQHIREYLPDELMDAEIIYQKMDKINCQRDCITFHKSSEEERILYPSLYLSSFYEKHKEGWFIKSILQSMGEELHKAVREMEIIGEKFQLEKLRDNVFFKLINTAQNEELLKTMPHRQFNDLSVVYAWYIDQNEKGMFTAPIKHDLAASANLSEEELFQLAKANTRRIFPTEIKPMNLVVEELMGDKEKEAGETFVFEPDLEVPLYVISNKSRNFGAAAVLYEDGLQQLADRLEDNLYMIPSSIHEWILLPQSFADLNMLTEMVHEVNFSQVDQEERLSNEVYHYDQKTRQVTVVSDVPDKRLGDHVADERSAYQAEPRCR